MASGTISAKWYNDYSINVSWSSTPTTSSNSSKVTATIKLYCPYELYIGSRTGTIKINGVSYSFTGGAISGSGTFTLGTVTSNAITHNNDGSKTVAISCSYPIKAYMGSANIYVENATCSGNATLDKIARAAMLTSAPNFNDEANPVIGYSNPAGSAVSSLQACICDTAGKVIYAAYRDISLSGTSYTFNLTDAERKALRQATIGSNELNVRFAVKTVLGGSTYYSSSDKKMTIINGTPTISNYTAAEVDYLTYTGSADIFIKGNNTVNVSMTVEARKEATITSTKIYCGAIGVNATSGTLTNVETGTVTFEATDSRGNTTKQTLKKTLINYFKPTITLEVGIPTAEGEVDLTVSGKVFSGSLGAMNNIQYAYFQYKEEDGNYNSWTTVGTLNISDNSYSQTVHITGLNYKKKYTFYAYITDYLNKKYSEEIEVIAIPVYDWGKNDFRVNVPMIIEDEPLADYPIEIGTLNGLKYEKMHSGRARLYGTLYNVPLTYGGSLSPIHYGYAQITLPNFFTSIDSLTYSAIFTNGYEWCGKSYIFSNTAFNIYICAVVSLADKTGTVRLDVNGTWK